MHCRAIRHVGLLFFAESPRFVQPPAQLSSVQTYCLEYERPEAVTVLAGGLTASGAEPPGSRYLERMREAKAEGKTKEGGTWVPVTSVCTWGRNGTAWLCLRAVRGVQRAPMLAYQRALYDRARPGLLREQP